MSFFESMRACALFHLHGSCWLEEVQNVNDSSET